MRNGRHRGDTLRHHLGRIASPWFRRRRGNSGGGSSYRYYRVYFIPNTSFDTLISGMELRPTPSGSDILAGASSITFSGTLTTGTIGNLTDGNAGTDIGFARTNVWPYIDIDLGAGNESDVQEMWVKGSATGARLYNSAFLVRSTDGVTYEPMFGHAFVQNNSVASGEEYTITDPAPSAPRFWGIATFANNDANWINYAEIEFRETLGGADATGSGTAYASSVYSTSGPANAYDGSDTTVYTAQKGSTAVLANHAVVGYDFGLGAGIDVAQIALQARSTVPERQPFDFFALAFDDDPSFLVVTGNTNGTADGVSVKLYLFETGNSAFTASETRTYDISAGGGASADFAAADFAAADFATAA